MNFDVPPEVGKMAPGAVGSFVSLLFIKESWPRRAAMFLAGAALARFGTENIAHWSGLNEGFTGFLLGLFGMSVVAKLFDWWQRFDLSTPVGDWVRKILGLPHRGA